MTKGTSPVVAFDLDGTLVENVPFQAYENDDLPILRSSQPNPAVVAYAKRLQDAGVSLIIVTGRHARVGAATAEVVARLGLGEVPVFERQAVAFELGAAVAEKAAHLRAAGAFLMVGDREDLDGGAAQAAGIPFLDVRWVT